MASNEDDPSKNDDEPTEEEKRQFFDLIAKILLLRLGTSVHITREEIEQAGPIQCRLYGTGDGEIVFKVVLQ